jgi:transposase
MARKKRYRKFTKEFKEEAVRLVEETDRSAAQVASELGIGNNTLRNWVKQARIDAGLEKQGELTTEEKQELKRLRKENKQLRMEKEILKKAAAFFAKENESDSNS